MFRPAVLGALLLAAVPASADAPLADPLAAAPDPGYQLAYVSPLISWFPPGSRIPFEGADYGSCLLEVAARDLVSDSAALATITAPRTVSDLLFVEQAAILAQDYALRNRDASDLLVAPPGVAATSSNPTAVEAALAAAAPSPERPARLYLTNEGTPGGATARRGHYVLAVGSQTRGNLVAYAIRDPNRPVPGELLYDRATGRFLPYGPFAHVRLDETVLPAENAAWIRRIAAALLDTPGQRALPLWIPAPSPAAAGAAAASAPPFLKAIEEPIADDELPGVVVGLADDDGHLGLYFDPSLFIDGHDPRIRWQMQTAFTQQALTGMAAYVVQRPLARPLRAIPLEALARDTAGARDTLRRVHGFAHSRRDSRVFVLADGTSSRPPIRTDWITAALLLEDSRQPALWFEPHAGDPFGPQRVVAEALPPRAAQSSLGRSLFDGDLTLKQIALGLDRPELPGFQSAWDLTSQDLSGSINHLSFWLRPRRAPGLGAWTVSTPDVEAVFFEERLGAFSGAREQLASFQPAPGPLPALTDRAARSLTHHLDALAVHRPLLADLQAIAEIRRLVTELHARGVTSPSLTHLARRSLPRVAVPQTVPAAGPRLITDSSGWLGGFTFVTGGIRLGAPSDRGDDRPIGDLLSDVLALFFAPYPGQPTREFLDLRLPAIFPLSPQRAARLRGWLETHRAAEEFASGRDEDALRRLEKLSGTGAAGPELHAWRSVIRASRGEHHAALQEISRAVAAYPELLAVRARLRAYNGDLSGARRDANQAALLYPHRPEILAQKAWVLLMSRDYPNAVKSLDALAGLNPTSPELFMLRAELAYQRRLGPARAARHVREVLETPQEIARLFKDAQDALATRDAHRAVTLSEEAVNAARRHALIVSVAQPHLLLEERARVSLAGALAARRRPGDADSAVRLMDELIRMRPSAWSPRLFKLDFGEQVLPLAEQVRTWEEADMRSRNPDPFGEDIQARRGDRLIDQSGYRLMLRLAAALDRDSTLIPVTSRLLARLAPRFRNAPEGRMIAVWQTILRTIDGPSRDSGPDLRVVQAIRRALVQVPTPSVDAGLTALDALKSLYAYPLTARRDTALPGWMSSDSAWQALLQRVNVRWNTPEKIQQAARVMLEATLLHCDRNLTRDLHNLLLRRLEYLALRQEPLTAARAIEVVDDARDILLRRYSARGFSRPLLVAFLGGFYERLLSPIVEPGQLPEIRGLLAARHRAIIPRLADAAATPVERRAAWAWIQFSAHHLPGQAPSTEIAGELVRQIFSAQARLEAADGTAGR